MHPDEDNEEIQETPTQNWKYKNRDNSFEERNRRVFQIDSEDLNYNTNQNNNQYNEEYNLPLGKNLVHSRSSPTFFKGNYSSRHEEEKHYISDNQSIRRDKEFNLSEGK